MAGIGELSVSITARTKKATANVMSFRKTVNRLPGSIAKAATSMTGLATAAAGLVGIGAIGNEIRKSFDQIDVLAKTSDKLGIATDKLASLRFAAEESGVSVTAFDNSLQRMIRNVSEAGQGTGAAKDSLAELGLNAQKLAGMSPDEQFKEISEAMSGVTSQTEKVRLAFDLFGREGVSIINTLDKGREGLDQYEQSAQKLGIAVNRFDAAQVEKANDAFARIGKVVEGLTNKIAIGLAPVIESVSDSLVEWGTNGERSGDQMGQSIEKVAKTIGFLADGLEIWRRGFASARAYIAEFFAWSAKKFASLAEIIADTLNKVPGIEVEVSEFTGVFAEEMEKAATQARKQSDAAWRKPWPSEGLDSMVRDAKEKLDKARRDFSEKQSAPVDAGLQAGASKLGSLLGSLTSGAASKIAETATEVGKQLQGGKIKVPGLATTASRGSREEYLAISQIQNRESRVLAKRHEEQKTLFEWMQSHLQDIAEKVDIADQMDSLAAAINGLSLGESV